MLDYVWFIESGKREQGGREEVSIVVNMIYVLLKCKFNFNL